MGALFIVLLLLPTLCCTQWALPEAEGDGSDTKGVTDDPTEHHNEDETDQIDPPPSPKMPKPQWIEDDIKDLKQEVLREFEKVALDVRSLMKNHRNYSNLQIETLLPHLELLKTVKILICCVASTK